MCEGGREGANHPNFLKCTKDVPQRDPVEATYS